MAVASCEQGAGPVPPGVSARDRGQRNRRPLRQTGAFHESGEREGGTQEEHTRHDDAEHGPARQA